MQDQLMDNCGAVTRSHTGARDTVGRTERLCTQIPAGIVLVLLCLGILPPLIRLELGSAIVGGIIMLIVGGLVVKAVNALVLNPMRSMRYKAVSRDLLAALQSAPHQVSYSLAWSAGAPGALAVTEQGKLAIADVSTGYDELWLNPSQILNVSVEREATLITNTKHGGAFSLGGVSRGGFFGGYTFGSRSRSTTTTVETAFLEIRYQLVRNGMTQSAVIPFGNDRRAADDWCATLRRLEHVEAAA